MLRRADERESQVERLLHLRLEGRLLCEFQLPRVFPADEVNIEKSH